MPQYDCRLALPSGEIVERMMVAADEGALRRELEDKDFLLLELRRRNALLSAVADLVRFRPRIQAREFLFFNQEFSALLRAGLPILTSLDILIERRKNLVFKKALVDIRDRVKSGEQLSEAFSAQGDLFPKLYGSSLASGERSGELPTVLKRYITYTRNIMNIRKKVVSAMIYPAILVTLSVVLIGVMMFYVIPNFSSLLKELGTDLPLLTQGLIDFSLGLRHNWLLIAVVAVGSVGGTIAWYKSDAGRVAIDRLSLRIPLVGRVIHDYAQNRFTRTLATLLSGGIPLVTSLELAARAVGNAFLEKEMMGVTVKVREGQPLWESLERTGQVSDMAVEMIKVGESTGALSDMLDNASEFSEEEIDHRLNKLITMIEPAMLIFMAMVVTIVLLALYMPLMKAIGTSKY